MLQECWPMRSTTEELMPSDQKILTLPSPELEPVAEPETQIELADRIRETIPPDDTSEPFDQLLEKYADVILLKRPGGGGGEPPERKFLGKDLGDWIWRVLTAVGAIAVFLVVWYNTVNNSLEELETRPTAAQVGEIVERAMSNHSQAPHPGAVKRLEALETQQRLMRESQVRQETIEGQQAKTLEEIRKELRRQRYRRR